MVSPIPMALSMDKFVHEEEEVDHPMRYLPIRHVYSSSSPCISPSGSSSIMSKKVKARKIMEEGAGEEEKPLILDQGELGKSNVVKPVLVYRRRSKKPRPSSKGPSFFDSLPCRIKSEMNDVGDQKEVEIRGGDGDQSGSAADSVSAGKNVKPRKKRMNYELLRLGAGSGFCSVSGPRLRGSNFSGSSKNVYKTSAPKNSCSSGLGKGKRWVELGYDGVDPNSFIGLACKVFWPMDEDWYTGSITGYNSATKQHCVEYDDGDAENLILLNEKIKFHISCEEMQLLNLKCSASNMEKEGLNYNEMLALAVSFDDCQGIELGDIVWAKLSGHAMWPAIVVNESHVGASKVLKPIRGDQSVLVQFFGTYDFSRIHLNNARPFLNGLLSFLHLKCKKTPFLRSLDEAKMYLSNQKLPKVMLQLQKGIGSDESKGACVEDEERADSSEDLSGEEMMQKTVECIKTSPIEIGDLRVTSLGKIVYDSEFFHNKQYIWPEGYTAVRTFTSINDPSSSTSYKMEVLRNPKSRARPLFRVTLDDGVQIDGPNPTACWKEIYSRIRINQCNDFHADVEGCDVEKPGSYMFGFSEPKISQLIQDLPNSRSCSKYSENSWNLRAGYRAVRVDWKDLDRCNVCHTDEEYEDNLFLQCDKCRMMVHARCYGELEPLDGVLWLCNLCRPGAPRSPPPCCLCPVIGGAIKPTTDGRWAHLTCAMWIPETCLLDVKRMEPIDGLSRINKDRWKLLCSICGVSYGACIQCSNSTCRVAYHPLCARAAGLCVELEDEDRLHLMFVDEDDDQCIRLLSFCKKHRQPSNELPPTDEKLASPARHGSSHIPKSNPSGCARSEPYNFFGRRGQKEPQVLAAASVKRLFVENRPYLVSGYRQKGAGCGSACRDRQTISSSHDPKLGTPQHGTCANIFSMAEKYKNMRATFRKRLAFGKSRIHGFGVFAKLAHKAGDMVIEYTGELVRPPIADIREHFIYNSLVGAGTYMFRIDDERVIDATRAGSIAHLINHSCEPNCYSRVISVHGDEHIIIFAKRDIKQWEELAYDYRFFSIDEQLACYCGFPRCRGVVNDADEQVARIRVPRCDLIHWRGE